LSVGFSSAVDGTGAGA